MASPSITSVFPATAFAEGTSITGLIIGYAGNSFVLKTSQWNFGPSVNEFDTFGDGDDYPVVENDGHGRLAFQLQGTMVMDAAIGLKNLQLQTPTNRATIELIIGNSMYLNTTGLEAGTPFKVHLSQIMVSGSSNGGPVGVVIVGRLTDEDMPEAGGDTQA